MFVGYGQGDDILNANVEKAKALRVSHVNGLPPHKGKLAIVGGGPSFLEHLDELRDWPGAIWAINGTSKALRQHGIESLTVTVDPTDDEALIDSLYDDIGQGLFASSCSPAMFKKFSGRCHYFHMDHVPGEGMRAKGSATTATRLHFVAFYGGFVDISYFGCEGSTEGASHGYDYYEDIDEFCLTIEAGGKKYRTRADCVIQSDYLSGVIREFPGVFHDRSGGLLSAMLENPDTWGFIDIPEKFQQHVKHLDV